MTKYYKRIVADSYYKKGVIYPDDGSKDNQNRCVFSVKDSARINSYSWEESTFKEYAEQEGWYVRGSEEFRQWVDNNSQIYNIWNCKSTSMIYWIEDNGYSWNGNNKEPKFTSHPYLTFYSDKSIAYGSTNGGYSVVSLEKALELLSNQPKFKEGDYVVVTQSKHSNEGKVVVIESLTSGGGETRPIRTKYISGRAADIHSKDELRKATDKEVEKALKRAEKVFGFDVKYAKDGSFIQFGCSDHEYTFDELERVVNTLGHIEGKYTVQELFSKLADIVEEW